VRRSSDDELILDELESSDESESPSSSSEPLDSSTTYDTVSPLPDLGGNDARI
jgi:hypothetical protein